MSKSVKNPTCYIEIDVNDNKASYERACKFVEENSIKYGLSSSVLTDLGGREMKSVEEFYSNDYNWSRLGRCSTTAPEFTRIEIELFQSVSPLACENFLHLIKGDKGIGQARVPLNYKGSKFHRLIPGFIIQGGDFTFGNGTGGESIWGKKFKDDVAGLKLKHDQKGIVSMGNSGKNSNSSQFFITLSDKGAPQCDKKHVVFGKITKGFDVLEYIEQQHAIHSQISTSSGEEPNMTIIIDDCGVI